MKLHTCAIAYASDGGFVTTAARAHGFTFLSQSMSMMASLDHCMWFHAPARVDQWLLYDMYSPRSAAGRGVSFGRMYSQDGTLIATTAQEGIMRLSEANYKKFKEAEDQLKQEVSSNLNKL